MKAAASSVTSKWAFLQRLFSNFANGWPGRGLLIERVVAGVVLISNAVEATRANSNAAGIAPHVVAAAAGILLIAGLWTPVAGILVALVETWMVIAHSGNTSVPLLLAAMGATLAMVGPGARSVDALLFGRKRLDQPTL